MGIESGLVAALIVVLGFFGITNLMAALALDKIERHLEEIRNLTAFLARTRFDD